MGREIPIVADDHVEEFGTGCVKVTPAHDPNDFAIGQRHGLPQITVMRKNGTMNKEPASSRGWIASRPARPWWLGLKSWGCW